MGESPHGMGEPYHISLPPCNKKDEKEVDDEVNSGES